MNTRITTAILHLLMLFDEGIMMYFLLLLLLIGEGKRVCYLFSWYWILLLGRYFCTLTYHHTPLCVQHTRTPHLHKIGLRADLRRTSIYTYLLHSALGNATSSHRISHIHCKKICTDHYQSAAAVLSLLQLL